jgi:hypothetical protein
VAILSKEFKLFCLSGKSLLIFRNDVKPRNEKYSAFHVGQITGISSPVSRPQEGRIMIVTTRWMRDAVDAFVQ